VQAAIDGSVDGQVVAELGRGLEASRGGFPDLVAQVELGVSVLVMNLALKVCLSAILFTEKSVAR
jgi:hypothetical protein